MKAWEMAGLPLNKLPQLSVEALREEQQNGSQLKVVDVRSPQKWESGHIPGAEHHFIGDLRKRITGLGKSQKIATYCASWSAWTAANFPVEGS